MKESLSPYLSHEETVETLGELCPQTVEYISQITDADYSALDRGSKKIGNTLSPIATDIDYAPPCF